MKTVAGLFPSLGEAQAVLHELTQLGVPPPGISILAGNDPDRHNEYLKKAREATQSAGEAAASTAAFGGGLGMIASIIGLAIPGVGPLLAGGAIAAVLSGLGIGAVTGGLIGAFHSMGISHEEAPFYEEAVRLGAVVVVAQVSEMLEAQAVEVFSRHGAKNLRDDQDTWKEEAWSGPANDPHPYVSDSSVVWHNIK